MKIRQIHIFYVLLFVVMIATTAAYHLLSQDWVMFRKAEKSFHSKQYSEALVLYEKTFDMGLQTTRVYFRIAQCFLAEGMFDEAVKWYLKLLEKDPENRNLKVMIARAVFWGGDMNQAVRYYREALANTKTD